MDKPFNIWFADLREKAGYRSQRQLALESGVANSTIARIESGEQSPSPETLKKLAPYLKTDYEILMVAAGYLPPAPDPNAAAVAKIAAALTNDPELAEFWEEISKREDLFLMFKQVRDLSPESIRKIIRVIKAIEDEDAE